jgi:hypothetical protein
MRDSYNTAEVKASNPFLGTCKRCANPDLFVKAQGPHLGLFCRSKKAEKEEDAVNALAEVVNERHQDGKPILKDQAVTYLNKEMEISQKRSRELITAYKGKLWDIREVGGKGGWKRTLSSGDTHIDDENGMRRKPAPRADFPGGYFRRPRPERATGMHHPQTRAQSGLADPPIFVVAGG